MIILVVAVSLSLGISFICSLMEACLLSLSNANIAEISQKSPRIGTTWKKFKENIQKPIAVILIINTLAHTIGAAISGAQFDKIFGSKWIYLFSIAYSLFMIQYTEILPKTLGFRFNMALARISAVPMIFLVRLFTPMVALIEFANRPFEGKSRKKSDSLAHEISLLAGSAVIDKTLSAEQASLISRSLQMNSRTAREIMVDKEDVITLRSSMNLQDAFLASHVHRHTRYPLIEGDTWDSVLGYVNFKDIVTALHVAPEDPTLKGISRPILFIAHSMTLNVMLIRMIREYQHIAVVTDDQGRAIGLVTLEDVIESLVGEIEDEFDRPPAMFIKLSENRWRIGGGVPLSVLGEKISRSFPASDSTIDELIQSQLQGRELVENLQVPYQGVMFRIRRVARGFVYDVIAEKLKTPA